jgi:hypothetical protein
MTLLSTEMQGFSRYALANTIRLLLNGLPDPTDILWRGVDFHLASQVMGCSAHLPTALIFITP